MGVGRGRDFTTLLRSVPSTETSYLLDVHHICYRLEALHPKKSPRRVDGRMLIGETQNKGIFPAAEKWGGKKRGCVYRKARILPSTVFSCQCRSNMSVDSAVLAGRHYKMNMPCPSGTRCVFISVCAGGDGVVSGLWRAGRVAVHGAD